MNVAVVMTVWNTPPDWIMEAVGSVLLQLGRDDDLIIVDDGSDHADTVQRLDLLSAMAKIIRIDHAGVGAASNAGIAATSLPLIARLDSDDHMQPGTLDKLREHLVAFPEVDAVTGGMFYMKPDGTQYGQVCHPPMFASPRHLNRMVHSGCMFRRALWEKVGGYSDHRAADWAFWCAAEAAGAQFSVLSHHVISRRIHPDSVSFRRSKHLQQWYGKQ